MTIEMFEMYKAENHELRELLRLEQELHIEKCKMVQELEESIKTLVNRYNYRTDIVDNKSEVNVYTSVINSLQDVLDGVPV